MEQKMIQSKWIWPSMILLSAGLAGLLAFTNSAFGLRPAAALWFLLVCPGMAFVQLLSIKEMLVQWTLAVSLSLALDALVAAILVYAHIWSPNVALVILIATSLVGVGLQLIPERWLALGKLTKLSLRHESDKHWYNIGMKSGNYRTANIKSAIGTTPRTSLSINPDVLLISKVKILLVESDGFISASVCDFFWASGYDVQCVQNADKAMHIDFDAKPDLILLDVESLGKFGWKVLQHLRKLLFAPIIILTSSHEKTDVLHSFHLGADDYMSKPFSLTKLEDRVAAVLSRSRTIHASKDIVASEELTINFEKKRVMVDDQQINLTPTEYRLLEALARHANRTIPLSGLLSEVRGNGHEGEEKYIKHFIWSLRRKIEQDPRVPRHLITRRGYGYRFE